MSNKTTTSGGFLGYRSAMQYQGMERELFMQYMIIARRDMETKRAHVLFGTPLSKRKYKPLVYGK